jgi:hypothetical protein
MEPRTDRFGLPNPRTKKAAVCGSMAQSFHIVCDTAASQKNGRFLEMSNKQFLESGIIVNTHGVKGELKVEPWSDTPDFLTQFRTILYR